MLLQRVTKHIKEQNWFAVIIDFLIVVSGIFIGLQVTEWSNSESEKLRLDKQFSLLRDEAKLNDSLIQNRLNSSSEILAHIEFIEENLKPDATSEKAMFILQRLVRTAGLPELTLQEIALNDLESSGALREIRGSKISKAISNWKKQQAKVLRVERDVLHFRDRYMTSYFLSVKGMAKTVYQHINPESALFEQLPDADIKNLTENTDIFNLIALRLMEEQGIVYHLELMQEANSSVLDALNDHIEE